jgi:DNA-binding response OmpR family regulator
MRENVEINHLTNNFLNQTIQVLHVDDDEALLHLTKEILETDNSIKVQIALSVKDAFEKLAKETFDVIVSDFQMPEKDGVQFLKELREQGFKIPFIIFTGKGREDVAVNALNYGAFRYLNKNGNPKVVCADLAIAIRQAAEQLTNEKTLQEKTRLNQFLLETLPYATFFLHSKTRDIPISSQMAIVNDNLQLQVFAVNRNAAEELQKSEQRLELMYDKLRVVGSLTRHDVRNKLFTIQGNVHLARRKLETGKDASPYLEKIDQAIEKIVEVFDFAKVYEKIGEENLALVNVEKTVKEVLTLFPEQPDLKLSCHCKGLFIKSDSLLKDVFFNLVSNTLRYSQKATKIKITFKEEDNIFKLIYEDDGVGFAENEKPFIFKDASSMTIKAGYGFFLIDKIINNYGWTIEETGEFGKGARFEINIPLSEDPQDPRYLFEKETKTA